MIKQNDAQECLDNLLDKLEDAGIPCPSVSINVVDFDFTGMKAKYNISEKSISVWKKLLKMTCLNMLHTNYVTHLKD